MKKPVYLRLLTLEISKVVMHDEKARLGYMDTDSFIVHVETGNIYEDTLGYRIIVRDLLIVQSGDNSQN